MECKKCGKIIDDYEIYCNDCKELLRKEKEYNNLIEENKELNKFEITKEVETLKNFNDEVKEDSFSLKDELKDLVNIEEIENSLKENDNKKIIIIIGYILIFILISVLIFILFDKKEIEPIEETKINYEKVINDYGNEIKSIVSKYLKEDSEVPSWSVINDLVTYNEYDVVCDIHNIYEDGNIYLDDCKVDDKKTKYSYGKKEVEIKEGKKIEVFKKVYDDNYYTYTNINEGNLELSGSIICNTNLCNYVKAYDKYVIIKENNEYYLYNYETSSIDFGPFNLEENNEENYILSYETKLYGILYSNDNQLNIYNVNTGKTIKNIDGELMHSQINFNPNVMYKYGYAVFKSEEKNNFLNLRTGNVSYTIDDKINIFIEDENNTIVYITTLNSDNSKITIYNSNGKKLFSGKEYNDIQLNQGKLIVSTDTNFYVYNSKLVLELTSKNYNILDLYNGFVAVIDNEYLKIIDVGDNVIATFDLKWDTEKYSLDTKLSGLYNDTEIKLFVNEKDSNKILECYYNTQTKYLKIKEITN